MKTMPLSHIIDSCRRADEYPLNLIDAGSVNQSILQEYRQRRVRRANDLFCTEGCAAVEFFRYEQSQHTFKSDVARSLHSLRQHLPCTAGHTQMDRRCSFLFIGARTSRDVLLISNGMMLWVLSVFQVLPSFSEFIFPFGRQLYAIDFQFSGFREDNRTDPAHHRESILELGRSGQDLQICYNLKTVEPKEGQSWPWSCRQTALFHSFDIKNGQASWIVIKANDIIRDRLREASHSRLKKDHDTYASLPKMFENTLSCHLVVAEWSGENWRWYINYFEEQLDSLKRRTIEDKVTKSATRAFGASPASTTAFQPTNTPPKRTWTWRSAFGRTNTAGSRMQTVVSPQAQQPLPPSVVVIEPEDPPELPPEYDPKFQEEDGNENENEYQIDELQNAQNLESKASEAILVLKSNLRILSHLRAYYKGLPDSRNLEQPLKDSMRACISGFTRRIVSIESDLEIHLDRLETITKLIAECKAMLYGIVEYQSMQANKSFAKEAQSSAERMEQMTKDMQDLTRKTTLETVLMRIITVVTVFFLPATFVSTFMSADIVHYGIHDSHLASGQTSAGAVKFFLCICFLLMFTTFCIGFGMYRWATRKAVR